jgi:hypothetical protein
MVAVMEEAGGGKGPAFSGRDPALEEAAFASTWARNNVLCRICATAAGGIIYREPGGWVGPTPGGGGGGGPTGGGGRGISQAGQGGDLKPPPGHRYAYRAHSV